MNKIFGLEESSPFKLLVYILYHLNSQSFYKYCHIVRPTTTMSVIVMQWAMGHQIFNLQTLYG